MGSNVGGTAERRNGGADGRRNGERRSSRAAAIERTKIPRSARSAMPLYCRPPSAVRRSAVPPFRLHSPMPRPRRAPHVHKFGGASLADSAAVRHAVEIVRRHRPEPTVVVVSAMAGTTDALLEVAQQAGAGESRTVASLIARLRSRHAEVARSLLPGGRLRADVLLYVSDLFAELEALAQGLRLLRELTPAHDRLARLPRRAAERPAGRRRARGAAGPGPSTWTRSTWFTPTPRSARPRPTTPAPTARSSGCSARCSREGIVPVVPGFIGATPEGEVATLGPRRLRPHRDAARPRARRRSGSRSGRTCPGCSPPIPAWCPTRGSFPSSTPAKPRSWPTTAPRCSTRARSSRSPAAASRSSCGRSPTPTHRAPRSPSGSGAGRNPVKALTAAGGQALAHRHRQRHARRAGHRRAHLRGAPRAADLRLSDLAGLLGALDLLQRARALRGGCPLGAGA